MQHHAYSYVFQLIKIKNNSIMHRYARFCMIMHNYVTSYMLRGINIFQTFHLCIIMHDLHTYAAPSNIKNIFINCSFMHSYAWLYIWDKQLFYHFMHSYAWLFMLKKVFASNFSFIHNQWCMLSSCIKQFFQTIKLCTVLNDYAIENDHFRVIFMLLLNHIQDEYSCDILHDKKHHFSQIFNCMHSYAWSYMLMQYSSCWKTFSSHFLFMHDHTWLYIGIGAIVFLFYAWSCIDMHDHT